MNEPPLDRRDRSATSARAEDLRALSRVLGAAFYDDPVMTWLLPNDTSRERRLARLFAVLLRAHYLPMGTVWTTLDKVGAALWAPPRRSVIPTSRVLRHGPSLLRAMGRRSIRGLISLTEVERQQPRQPFWYLGVLGTAPEHQGKGVGSALLQPALQRCDTEGIGAYLESSKESNIAFYHRHGFDVTGEIGLPGGGPTVWPMWRNPSH